MMWAEYNGERYDFDYRLDNKLSVEDALEEICGSDFDPVMADILVPRSIAMDFVIDLHNVSCFLVKHGVMARNFHSKDVYVPHNGHMVKLKPCHGMSFVHEVMKFFYARHVHMGMMLQFLHIKGISVKYGIRYSMKGARGCGQITT